MLYSFFGTGLLIDAPSHLHVNRGKAGIANRLLHGPLGTFGRILYVGQDLPLPQIDADVGNAVDLRHLLLDIVSA